jgi:hypothetical protein
MSQITQLAIGAINASGDQLRIQLVEPADMPPVVRIVWPIAATITTPARYLEVASTAMRLLAEASNAGSSQSEQAAVTRPTGG